jgi:hypothetical protein
LGGNHHETLVSRNNRVVLLLIAFTAFSYSFQAFGQTDTGWITLFDGKNLDNWGQIGTAN